MMRITFLLILSVAVLAFVVSPKPDVKKNIELIAKHLDNSLAANKDTLRFPRSTKPDGSYTTTASDGWTSGFYSGILWQMYDCTKDKKWEQAARRWTAGLEKEKLNTYTHDLGFMLHCSFGSGYLLTNDPAYKEILLEGAKSLSTRFSPITGCIKSWDHGRWQFPVIIDNMMNLEFLFWATKVSGDSSFYKIAVIHANTTLQNHFRSDNSSYHVVDYDTITGKVLERVTAQGAANESAWARGQAGGLFGYTPPCRETKDKR
jgi:hypothetical protein